MNKKRPTASREPEQDLENDVADLENEVAVPKSEVPDPKNEVPALRSGNSLPIL